MFFCLKRVSVQSLNNTHSSQRSRGTLFFDFFDFDLKWIFFFVFNYYFYSRTFDFWIKQRKNQTDNERCQWRRQRWSQIVELSMMMMMMMMARRRANETTIKKKSRLTKFMFCFELLVYGNAARPREFLEWFLITFSYFLFWI